MMRRSRSARVSRARHARDTEVDDLGVSMRPGGYNDRGTGRLLSALGELPATAWLPSPDPAPTSRILRRLSEEAAFDELRNLRNLSDSLDQRDWDWL
jgi:hypothetical protein